MSDSRVAAIGEILGGAPDHLVERSAEARAAAQGITVDEVLSAWSGGAVLAPTAPPPASDPVVAETEAPAAPAPAPVDPIPGDVPQPALQPVAVAAVEVVEEEEEIEPVDPAPLADRVRLGAKVGAGFGAVLGLVSFAAMAPLMLTRLSQTTAAGAPAGEVTWTYVAATAVVWTVAGAIINVASRGMGRFRSPAFDTETGWVGSVFSGGFLGLVVGAAFGGVLYATGEASLSGTQLLAVSPLSIMWTWLGWTALGALIGGLGQAMAQPAALSGTEAEEAREVRKRLTDGLAMPVLATLVIAVIVVAFGSLLLRYAAFAPLIAILVSIGTIGFAALMSSRPNLRVTKAEFLVAAAGVGVVLTMLALIAAALSGEGDEGGAGEPAGHALEYVITDPASR
ncbi:MAG: hypothetical protein OXM57_10675 [bacterium]|nr:hypothetical protein [bacterium]MDE0353142.1 hypothetical protein [bacterium]